MGMRQCVELQYGRIEADSERNGSVFIYSHWDGDDDADHSPLAEKVRTALARKERWGDESYLARIIFSEIIKEDIAGESGYGIAPSDHYMDEEFPRIVVDLTGETVNGIPFEEWINL